MELIGPPRQRKTGKRLDLTGVRFGNLVAVRYARRDSKNRKTFWLCRCDCGQEVERRLPLLRIGRVKSCGVNGHHWRPRSEVLGAFRSTSEYRSWERMRRRCFEESHDRWKHYGGRGITVCPQWRDDFMQFLSDMGVKPTPKHTIERNDVNGNYEPGNCRWATMAEQARNMRRSVYVEYEGERLLLIDLCARLGLKAGIVRGRMKMGWSLDRAVTQVVRQKQSSHLL